jgi:hypothetical protein
VGGGGARTGRAHAHITASRAARGGRCTGHGTSEPAIRIRRGPRESRDDAHVPWRELPPAESHGEAFEPAPRPGELEPIADLARYTTSIAADDLDEVCAWLGYDKINLAADAIRRRCGQSGAHSRRIGYRAPCSPHAG